MVKHLRNFHGKVEALRGLKADVADGTVTSTAANTQTPTEVTVVGDVEESQPAGGLTATQG